MVWSMTSEMASYYWASVAGSLVGFGIILALVAVGLVVSAAIFADERDGRAVAKIAFLRALGMGTLAIILIVATPSKETRDAMRGITPEEIALAQQNFDKRLAVATAAINAEKTRRDKIQEETARQVEKAQKEAAEKAETERLVAEAKAKEIEVRQKQKERDATVVQKALDELQIPVRHPSNVEVKNVNGVLHITVKD